MIHSDCDSAERRVASLEDGPLKQFLTQLVAFDGVIVPRHIAVQRVKQKRGAPGFVSDQVLAILHAPCIPADPSLPIGDRILPTI